VSRKLFKVQKPKATYKGFVELSADELYRLYLYPPERPETPLEEAYRNGHNNLIIELIGKIKINER
jgi:hypothetical protein